MFWENKKEMRKEGRKNRRVERRKEGGKEGRKGGIQIMLMKVPSLFQLREHSAC